MEIFRLFKISKKQYIKIRGELSKEYPLLIIRRKDWGFDNIFISDKLSKSPFDKLGIFPSTSYSRPILVKTFIGTSRNFYISESNYRSIDYETNWFVEVYGMPQGSIDLYKLYYNIRQIIFANEKELTRWLKK